MLVRRKPPHARGTLTSEFTSELQKIRGGDDIPAGLMLLPRMAGRAMQTIASRAALQTPRKGSAITYPEQVVGIRPVSTKISDPEGWQAAADKREIAEWNRTLKAHNADRARRGLPPLPTWQPARPFNPTGRYWMGQ
jgi:hypothetical protein